MVLFVRISTGANEPGCITHGRAGTQFCKVNKGIAAAHFSDCHR